MNGIANRPARPPASTVGRALRRPWLQVLVIGSALWLLLTWGTLSTKNFHLVPSVIVMGAFLGPVAFVAWVYDRAGEPCDRCGSSVRRTVIGARSTYHCPRCQRAPRARAAR